MAKRGRPPLSDEGPSTDVVVALPPSVYDRLYRESVAERVSVPEVIRRKLGDTKSEKPDSSLTL
jgi:hypothetical protein